MTHHRGLPVFLIPISCLVATAAVAQVAPEKALKYHEALLKRPHNAALFDRFYGAWIDEQAVETLGEFLKARATTNGGQDWTVLATYQLRRGQEEEALETLGKAIGAVPEDAALPMERAKLLLRRLDFDKARADLAKVAAGKDEVLALEASKLIGKSWLREGKTDEAIKAWDAVLAGHPGDEDLLEDLVETAAAESEMAQALVYIGKLIEVSRDPYQKTLRMMRRGDLLAQAGKTDEAVETYAGTLDKVGAGSWLEREVLAQIEKLFRKQDRLDDLGTELKKLAETYPQRLAIHRQVAKLEAAQGETDAAIGRFREVLKRSPGERELREEFIRMLSDGERFDDAVVEVEKLIELAPADAELYLQIAGLRSRQGKPEAVLAALNKAHDLLGKDEGSGIRIANLMLQYGQNEPGEALLKQLADAPGAGPVVMEVLATQYGQKQRKEEAVALLKKAGAGNDPDILLRTTGSISALGENGAAFEILMARADPFASDPRFLTALAQAGLAANKPMEVMPQVLKLVRLAKQAAELSESINLASRVIAAADKPPTEPDQAVNRPEQAAAVRSSLEAQASRTPAETCLLASLIETAGDFEGVEKLLAPQTDSMTVHFHAALLDRRGEFDQAIAVLSRLADTEEGKKAAYFKDLSELQQRAGKTADALATVERWKLAAPGDKAAWITGSRLLRECGKPDDAVKMTRQAVARFEGDTDLEASLATLHDEAGQWADSEAIYWRLYDESQSPTDQARWAAQLALLAQRTGKASELEEKLQERARGNRRSIGPLLAQAELARVTNNEDKRRDLLLDAVRLQPKDLDLRMQISEIEEKSGNPERVLAVLEEAMPFDVNGRVRGALAQAYLRQGQAVKGMRELRLLSGKSGFDARSAESAAASLAAAKLYDEAVGLLRTELKHGGDWRTQYLLAMLLEDDGREDEATPVFLSLLQAEGEIPGLVIPVPPGAQGRAYINAYPKQMQGIFQWMLAGQLAYVHRNSSRGGYYMNPGNSMVGPFSLPNTPEDVRRLALVHLCTLGSRKSGKIDEALLSQLKAAGVTNAPFIADFASTLNPNGGGDYAKLLESHPDEPGLLEWIMSYAGMNNRNGDTGIFRKVLENAKTLSPVARFNAWSNVLRTAEPDDAGWALWLAAAKECVEDKSPDSSANIGYQMLAFLQAPQFKVPEKDRGQMKALMLAAHARNTKEHPEYAHTTYSLSVIALAGTTGAWLDELNAVIRAFRENPAQQGRNYYGGRSRFAYLLQNMISSMSRGYGGYSSAELFKVPTIETINLKSLPPDLLQQWLGSAESSRAAVSPLGLADLVKQSDKISSPLLRAILAVKAGDAAAITKALAATPPREEAADFEIVRSIVLLDAKKNREAFEALAKARAAGGSDRDYSIWLNFSMLAVAGRMSPEERAPIADQLQATILQCRQSLGQSGGALLVAQARLLGLEELAQRLQPAVAKAGSTGAAATGPAAMAVARGSSSGSGGGSIEKVRKFVMEKKYDAAAREVLLGIRNQNAQTQRYYIRNELQELITVLGKDGQEALIKQLDPGDSKSLVRRLEFIDVCNVMGKPGAAGKVLDELALERPDDAAISARLIFTLPPEQDERWIKLMSSACKSDELVSQAHNYLSNGDRGGDNKLRQDFFERVARWLETADPAAMEGANLTWVTYHAKRFFTGQMTRNLPSMLSDEKEAKAEKEPKDPKGEIARQKTVCEHLARAMLLHPGCAEEGFRLLAAAKAWKLEASEKDKLARQSMLATATGKVGEMAQRYGGVNYFQFQSNEGGTSDGEDLAESSSMAWLVTRMDEEKKPEVTFPPDFLESIKQRNAKAGDLMMLLTRNLKTAELEGVWNSDVMNNPSDRFGMMVRPLLLKRFVATPGATQFFVDRISKVAPGQAVPTINYGNQTNTQLMFYSALSGAAMGKPGELDAVAKAIKTAVFGDKVEFSETEPQVVEYQRLNFIESMFQQASTDGPAMVRMQGAFFRLGVPVDGDEYGPIRPFQNKRFDKPAEAEAYFESLGWLAEADRWEPYAAMLYQRGGQSPTGNGYAITLKPTLMLDRVLQYMGNGNMERKDLIKLLKERKKGRFGSLMMAAALSSGKERSDLASQAFIESSAALAKLPADRISSLSLVLPWLSDEAKAKLPEKLRGKMKGQEDKIRASALAQADRFLESMRSSPFENVWDQADEAIRAVWPYDADKAATLMIAVEQAYTDSLTRGGRFSNATTGEWQIPARDYIFGQVLGNRGEDEGTPDPERMFSFMAKLLESPSGRRMAFNDSTYNKTSLFTKLAQPLLKDGKEREGGDRIVQLVEVFQARKGKGPQSVVFPSFLLTDLKFGSGAPEEKDKQATQAQLAKLTAKDPQATRLATVKMAFWAWERFTPEEKAEARKTCGMLLADGTIPDVARLALANDWLKRIPLADRFDEPFCTALAKLYQDYASVGRTAITFASEDLFTNLATSSGQGDFVTAMDSAVIRAFWDNAGAPNVAGHPPIPSSLAQATFITAIIGKDKELIAKTFPKIKDGATGRLGAMIELLLAEQYEFARQISPAPAELFKSGERNLKYTRRIETALKAFGNAGGDPRTLLKLEIEMLAISRAEGDEAPAEPVPDQLERVATAFIATPPEGSGFPWMLGTLLAKAPGNPRLMPLLMDWVKKEPVSKFIILDRRGGGSADERARKSAMDLHGIAVMHALALGDAAPLQALIEAADVPVNPNQGSNSYLCQDLIRMNAAMARTIWLDVGFGSTDGYAAGSALFNKYVSVLANQVSSYDSSSVNKPLAVAGFLAAWAPDPAAFVAMCDSLPGQCAEQGKKFAKDPGFVPFAKSLADAGAFKLQLSPDGREAFLRKILTIPGFTASYPKQVGWVEKLAQAGLKKEINAIALEPPADIVPAALPELYEQKGTMKREKHPGEAIEAFRKGVELCPADPAWNHSRGVLKWKLADALNSTDQKDEAKKVFASIPPEEVAEWLKNRYETLAKTLDAKPKK